MRRRGPEEEEEACGVWLDAAALKRRKAQTHLIKSSTKMLTLFPGERKTKISFTQRSHPPAGTRQTSIASFFTLQPGKTNGGDQKNVSSHIESQANKESKEDAVQLDHLIQGLEDDCMAPPLATSTPADIQEATRLSPKSLRTNCHHETGIPCLTVLSLFQPDTLVHAKEGKASLACSFTQDMKNPCLLDQKEGEDSSWKREWLHGSKKNNYQSVERDSKTPGRKCHQLLDKTNLENVSSKTNSQSPVLQTYKEFWTGADTAVKQSPCPPPVFSWDSEKNDKDSWSQLFTEDSQGQRVIAHNSRAPFRDVTNDQNQGLGQLPNSPWAQGQDRTTQLNLQPDLLFTQDSEVQALARQDCCRRFVVERQKHLW
uniref:Aurora kinase A and ninein interacting protein n=1 Tax=Sus scrofa TaxID=9823 RepID=A0A8D1WSB6_PIG